MSFYNVLRESTAVQEPENIGNDLDQIEKDIFEDREDETDTANNGVLNDDINDTDIVEEAYNIIYESEYNHNQLLKAIGLHELNEAYHGRELLFEAADAESWFDKVIAWFKNLFAKFADAVSRVLKELDFIAKHDKNLAVDYENDKAKYEKYKWSYKGYNYLDLRSQVEETFKAENQGDFSAGRIDEIFRDVSDCCDTINNAKDDEDMKAAMELVEGENERYKFTQTVKEMEGELYTKLRGGSKEKIELYGVIDIDKSVISILKSDRDMKYIRDVFNNYKKFYKDLLERINKLRKEVKKAGNRKDSATTAKLKVCDKFINFVKTGSNINTMCKSVFIKCAKEQRYQARAIVNQIMKKGTEEKKDSKDTALNDSSIFAHIDLV